MQLGPWQPACIRSQTRGAARSGARPQTGGALVRNSAAGAGRTGTVPWDWKIAAAAAPTGRGSVPSPRRAAPPPLSAVSGPSALQTFSSQAAATERPGGGSGGAGTERRAGRAEAGGSRVGQGAGLSRPPLPLPTRPPPASLPPFLPPSFPPSPPELKLGQSRSGDGCEPTPVPPARSAPSPERPEPAPPPAQEGCCSGSCWDCSAAAGPPCCCTVPSTRSGAPSR